MGKITIKHYLNKTVKPIFNGKTNTYPIYVQIIANRVNYKMKSNFDYWDGYISEDFYNSEFIQKELQNERSELEVVVAFLIDNDKKEYLNATSIKLLSSSLWSTLNRNFGKFFTRESQKAIKKSIPDIFFNSGFLDINSILFYTESHIESDFSEDYNYARIGMDSLFLSSDNLMFSELKINTMSVFSFLFDIEARKRVYRTVECYYGFHGGNDGYEDGEYNNVLKALENIIFIDE